jgi:hypothetical protein
LRGRRPTQHSNDRQNADRSDCKRALSPHDRALYDRTLSATATAEPRCTWYSRAANIRAPGAATTKIFIEGDYQPMKIAWQKLDESNVTLVPIVK